MATEIISNKGTNGEPVTYADGTIASGIRIIAYHTGGEFASDGDIFTTTTDSAGEYAFTDADLPATYLNNETAKTDYVHLFAEIGSGSSPRQATPIRPWQSYQLETEFRKTVDDFEDNDLAEYTNTANFDTTTNNAIEGNYALKLTGGDPESFMYSFPGDGLGYYFTKGEIASVYARAKEVGGNNSAPVIGFGVPSSNRNSGYAIANWNFASWRLFRYDNGSRTKIADSGDSSNDGEWYEYEIEWHDGTGSEPDGTIKVTRYTIDQTDGSRISQGATISAQDTTYSGDGVFYTNESADADGIAIADKYEVIGVV